MLWIDLAQMSQTGTPGPTATTLVSECPLSSNSVPPYPASPGCPGCSEPHFRALTPCPAAPSGVCLSRGHGVRKWREGGNRRTKGVPSLPSCPQSWSWAVAMPFGGAACSIVRVLWPSHRCRGLPAWEGAWLVRSPVRPWSIHTPASFQEQRE